MADASRPDGGVPAGTAVNGSTSKVGLVDRPGASGPPLSGKTAGGMSRVRRERRTIATLFLVPALVMLAVLVVWPFLNTIWLSLHDRAGTSFVGLDNYVTMFKAPETRRAITNNVVWVVVTPTVVTILGLVFAVLTERIKLSTAFKTILFMPMAISFLSAGVTWRLVYDQNPDRGVLNAIIVGVHDTFSPPSPYAGVRPRDNNVLEVPEGGPYQTVQPAGAGTAALLPMVGLNADKVPGDAYPLRLPRSDFAEAFAGVFWLGPSLITPSIIVSYLWIWAGFAMVLISAGLAALPRESLEAARVDGATEWQVFRRVTVPLVRPVLIVVLVTLIINVLKIFDLVYILAPDSSQSAATVVAVQMYKVSFGGGQDSGLGSALGVLLFLLVVPAMIFNIRRLRRDQT